jgi:hypothetical protein
MSSLSYNYRITILSNFMNDFNSQRGRFKSVFITPIFLLYLATTTLRAQPGTDTPPEITSPDFGPNVLLFDPSMDKERIKDKCDAIYAQQEKNQFGSERYAILFKPGVYEVNVNVGYYTQVGGLGKMPDDVAITGEVHSGASGNRGDVTDNFWRACENLAIVPTNKNTEKWAVSQACPFRRMHVKGDLALTDGGWASGGFMADSKIEGTVESGSQQQWFSRNSEWNSWKGSVWNMVFLGTVNPPLETWPAKPFTTIDKTPLIREKPFLYLDSTGNYNVFVPGLEKESAGCSWTNGQPVGDSIPISKFYIARPDRDSSSTINDALSQGKNLLLTPGIYRLDAAIQVTHPDTVVLGLGLATLQPVNGTTAMEIADVSGVKIAGILFDAGTSPSPSLLQVGPPGSSQSHADNPTFLFDVFCRVGGVKVGATKTGVVINSNDVMGDDAWIWRADHGTGIGWNVNTGANGLVVNGANVTYYGLFVEHFQEAQTLWNGENGRVYFYQCEMPYDPPSQDEWKRDTVNGWPGFKVADSVKIFEAWGLGIYSAFRQGGIGSDNAMEVPKAPGVHIHHVMTVRLGGGDGIKNVINGSGDSHVLEYPAP